MAKIKRNYEENYDWDYFEDQDNFKIIKPKVKKMKKDKPYDKK